MSPVFEISAKPWFAVGGINLDTIDEVIAAGARRVCVVSAITKASDPQQAAAAAATPAAGSLERGPGNGALHHAGAVGSRRPDALRTSGSSNP